jgi:hypothetical protein
MIPQLIAIAVLGVAPQSSAPKPEVRRIALVFAANDGGPDRERLRYAADDARAFSSVLQDLGGVAPADRILLLDATRADVERAVDRMQSAARVTIAAGGRVELILYYSGHSDEQGLGVVNVANSVRGVPFGLVISFATASSTWISGRAIRTR